MTTTTPAVAPARRGGRPPPWRDVRVLAWIFQFAVLAVAVFIVSWLWDNLQVNSQRQNIPTSFDYLDQPAGFPIANSAFRQTQPVHAALVVGLLNTLRLAVVGIVLATVFGTLLGVARLSKNFLVRKTAQVYVETVRNVPLLGIIILIYLAVVLNMFPKPNDALRIGPLAVISVRGATLAYYEGATWKFLVVVAALVLSTWVVVRWRRATADRRGVAARTGWWALGIGVVVLVVLWLALGLGGSTPTVNGRRVTGGIAMTPEYFAALAGLVLYTSSHIAEIVRGSIQAVPRGQGEAADALALSGFQRVWFVVLPQAMRIAVPPIGNQYLNLAKNSSLAAVISFPELTQVTQLSVANRSPAVPSYALLLLIYLVLCLVLSTIVNLANRHLAIVER